MAAALAEFGAYGLHATTRAIAALAGHSIAALTYYFGSREVFDLACARWIAVWLGAQ
ncbi:TetR family transcriptional regulator, partial [Salmonella enterica subsp. enterica serovar Infantis]